MNPDNEERRVAMFKDNKLRLLMTLAGFQRLGVEDEPGVTWIIPSTIAARELHETHEMIEKHRNNPMTEYGEEGDKKTAEDMLRRASTEKKRRVEYDDDSGGDDGFISEGDEDFLYAPGGPTPMEKRADALDQLKKKRRRHKNKGDEDILTDDEARHAKRKAKLAAEKENMRRMKSKLMVGDSDEESNEEADRAFFAGEEALRRAQAEKALEALNAGELNGITSTLQVNESKKRKSGADGDLEGGGRRRKQKKQKDADSVKDGYATPASSSSPETRQANNLAALDLDSDNDDDDDMNDFTLEKTKSRNEPAIAIDVDSQTTNGDVDALLPSSKRQRAVNIAEDEEAEGEAAPKPGRSRRPPAKMNSLAAPYSDDGEDDDEDDDDMNDHSLERIKTTKPTTQDANSDSSAILLAPLSPQNIKPHSSLPIFHIDSENEVLELPSSSSLQQRRKPSKSTVSNLDSDNDMKDYYPSHKQTPKQQGKKSPNFATTTTTTGDIGSSPQQQQQQRRRRRRRDHHRRRSDSQVSSVLSKQGEGTSSITTTVNDADEDEDDEMDVPPPTAATIRRRRRGKVADLLSSESE